MSDARTATKRGPIGVLHVAFPAVVRGSVTHEQALAEAVAKMDSWVSQQVRGKPRVVRGTPRAWERPYQPMTFGGENVAWFTQVTAVVCCRRAAIVSAKDRRNWRNVPPPPSPPLPQETRK